MQIKLVVVVRNGVRVSRSALHTDNPKFSGCIPRVVSQFEGAAVLIARSQINRHDPSELPFPGKHSPHPPKHPHPHPKDLMNQYSL